MPNDGDITLTIRSDPHYLCVVRAAIDALLVRLGMSPDDCVRVVMAVDEALTNIIRHGYRGRTDRPITIKLSPIHPRRFEGVQIVIEDETDATDLSMIRRLRPDETRPGGLGVHIIHEAVDEVEYERREDGPGLRLTLRKFTNHGVASPKSAEAG